MSGHPYHVAITRRALPGKEAEFKEGLLQFFHESFRHGSVLGASMIVPPPGSDSREFGILRSFTSKAESVAFYESDMFRVWDERAAALTEGQAEYRDLDGLEAWFRAPQKPPRWKMAVATLIGVYPTSLFLSLTIGLLTRQLPLPLGALIFSAAMVGLLTWLVMPFVTKLMRSWLVKKL